MFALPVLLSLVSMLDFSSGGSHSLRYFYTGVSGAPPELVPEFVAVGYVDEAPIDYYDSVIRRDEPRAQWMKEREGPEYWDRNTQTHISWQQWFKAGVQILMDRTNQTGGVHTVQYMYGCQLDDNGNTDGFRQYGFDGNGFLVYDMENFRWIAASQPAEITVNKWNADTANLQYRKQYITEICIDWLKKYITYGEAALKKQSRPEVQVTDTRSADNIRLVCVVTGFYPRDIDVYFVKNGKDQMETAESSGIIPNNDGTYQIKKEIEIGPQDESSYACHVEHASVKPKLTVMWEPKSASNIPLIVGIIAAVVIVTLICAIVGVVIWKKKAAAGSKYTPANKTDKGESSSTSSAEA